MRVRIMGSGRHGLARYARKTAAASSSPFGALSNPCGLGVGRMAATSLAAVPSATWGRASSRAAVSRAPQSGQSSFWASRLMSAHHGSGSPSSPDSSRSAALCQGVLKAAPAGAPAGRPRPGSEVRGWRGAWWLPGALWHCPHWPGPPSARPRLSWPPAGPPRGLPRADPAARPRSAGCCQALVFPALALLALLLPGKLVQALLLLLCGDLRRVREHLGHTTPPEGGADRLARGMAAGRPREYRPLDM